MTLRFYTSVVKELKVKVRKFLGLIPTFLEVTGEKLVGVNEALNKYNKNVKLTLEKSPSKFLDTKLLIMEYAKLKYTERKEDNNPLEF